METLTSNRLSARTATDRFTGRCVHLIGVGGSGMRALAKMLMQRGAIVSGSDMAVSGATERLKDAGAAISLGQCPENIPTDCQAVVYSAAINEQNPELIAARQLGVKVMKYSQMLGELMAEKDGIAVAGTHGKSTTSAMAAYVLKAAGADPDYIIGAMVEQLGGPSGVGRGRHFVAEACEYDRSFLNLRPKYGAILNIEEDHLDCYQDIGAIVEAFRQFAARVPSEGVLVVNGEDRESAKVIPAAGCAVETFGMADGCTWRGVDVESVDGLYCMNVLREGRAFCRLELSLAGLHNAYNALAACGLLYHAGLEADVIAEHIGSFRGAYRRITLKGRRRGVTVVDDFAHHPTEINVTLRAIRERYQARRMLCVFQPHQHSRTRFLLKDFARSFGSADEVFVPDIYFVRDSAREKDHISSQDLVAQIRLHGGQASYHKSFDEIVDRLSGQLRAGDVVVTMGAGDIWQVADEIVRRLSEGDDEAVAGAAAGRAYSAAME